MKRGRPTAAESKRRREDALPLLNEGGNLGLYLAEIARYTPLPTKEEMRLAPLIRAGDTDALIKLVNANLRFVVSVARIYQNQGVPLIDLINEGNLGLLKAARRFDEKKNFKFISYAVWWIRQCILQALANNSRVMRVPLNQVSVIARLHRAKAELEQRYRRDPTMQELAREVGMRESEVVRVMGASARASSLDAPAWAQSGDSSESRLDRLEKEQDEDGSDAPDSSSEAGSDDRQLAEYLSVLGDRERAIVRRYFGIGHETEYTLEEIGRQFNITRERVRQVKEAALGKLRRHGDTSVLRKVVS